MKKRAVVLLSGGLDSVTALAVARSEGYAPFALSFDYGQRHNAEIRAACRIAREARVEDHKIMSLSLDSFGGSALTDSNISVPDEPGEGIPVTYVPARNTIFLSMALAWAEVISARDIFIGVNAVDYSGYPDCRPQFIKAFEELANVATKAGVEGHRMKIHAPLINLSKADIIRLGTRHGVNYANTISCYSADHVGRACGICDACRLRTAGFQEAGIKDPTRYTR